METRVAAALLACALSACGAGGGSVPSPSPTATPTPAPILYQPLAVGDQWTYACGLRGQQSTFTITNSVLGTQPVNGVTTYEFSLQIPSSPTQSTTEMMLLANDAQDNLWLYGYVVGNAVQSITPVDIAPQNPAAGQAYDYPAPDGTIVSRIFQAYDSTNSTPYAGVYQHVAVYYESGGTHNYGYAANVGIAEEDHGPNFQYDCLLSALTLH